MCGWRVIRDKTSGGRVKVEGCVVAAWKSTRVLLGVSCTVPLSDDDNWVMWPQSLADFNGLE